MIDTQNNLGFPVCGFRLEFEISIYDLRFLCQGSTSQKFHLARQSSGLNLFFMVQQYILFFLGDYEKPAIILIIFCTRYLQLRPSVTNNKHQIVDIQ